MLGGGNVKKLKTLPKGTRPGKNFNAFLGGFRLWGEGVEHLADFDGDMPAASTARVDPPTPMWARTSGAEPHKAGAEKVEAPQGKRRSGQ